MMIGSNKKLIDAVAVDLSKHKWPDSGVNMFNVTLATERYSPDNKYIVDLKKKESNCQYLTLR